MVTSTHEASHRIFQDRPELLTPVFDLLGVPMSAKASVSVLSADVTEIQPLERRVDTVLRVEPSDGCAFLLAVETQGLRDNRKATSWSYVPMITDRRTVARNLAMATFSATGDTPARQTWRKLMSFTNFFPGRGTLLEETYLEGQAEGEAKGEAKAILRFLEARGISVPEEARDRIADCTDLGLLNRWLDRTPHVRSVDELFAEDQRTTADQGEAQHTAPS
ncbi:hypothetical protein ACIRUL_08165 [Streptomyces sp. NPDC101171]|uniref:hypothetical protein n=1 Tax=Streptomyces sp. NPDC101171 TaxID=3366122 RepID=UPI00382B9F19